jgi:hypothetical protein
MRMLLKLARRNEKPVFVNNKQEFLSVWATAHVWAQLPQVSTDINNLPAPVLADIDTLLLAYVRDEISLRTSYGYRVLGHTVLQTLFGLDEDYERISDQLYRKKPLDASYLDTIYVRRSELLHWCEKEYREPPACWTPQFLKVAEKPLPEDVEEAEGDGWLDQLTERRRRIVACLEVARHLWEKNSKLSYEDVYNHPLLAQTGLRVYFTFDSFKKWARRVASDEAKRGGRRSQSMA